MKPTPWDLRRVECTQILPQKIIYESCFIIFLHILGNIVQLEKYDNIKYKYHYIHYIHDEKYHLRQKYFKNNKNKN